MQEDLKRNTNKILQETFTFLGVNNSFKSDISVQHNESGIPNNFFSKFLLSRNNFFSAKIREVMKKIIPRKLLEKIASKSLKKVSISSEDITYLKPFFLKDICELEKLINRDLSNWK